MSRTTRRPSPSWRGSGRLLLALGCAVAAQGAGAQSIGYQEEYQKLIDAEQKITPLTGALFGDSVNLYNGSTTFTQTDVSLAGNSELPVAFGRRFTVENRGGGGTTSNRYPLGDWDLDVPFISAVFVKGQGWLVRNPNGRQASPLRCSLPQSADQAMPPDALDINNQTVEADQYWIAPTMYVPGQGSQTILFKSAQSNAAPTDNDYRWVTANHWYLGCLKMGDGTSEGFFARSPSGVTYYFDYEVKLDHPSIVRDLGPDAQGHNHATIVNREEVRLYATRIEDRFTNPAGSGRNQVVYNWQNGELRSISANDSRLLTINYAGGRVASVSDGVRTWSYTYDPALQNTLTSVTLPDASRWTFGLRNLQSGLPVYPPPSPSVVPIGSYCNKQKPLKAGADNVHSGWITHPSGATGTFTFQLLRHGRTNVDLQCDQLGVDEKYIAGRIPVQFDTHSLIRKEVTGPGLPSAYAWTYEYEILPGSNICNPLGCPAQALSKTVTVTAPDAVRNVSTFGVRFGENEGQLLGTLVVNEKGATARQQTNEYVSTAEAASLPFPPQLGHLLNTRTDTMSTWLRPQKKRLIAQDGATFQWEGSQFDRFGRATRERRGSSAGGVYNVEQTLFDDNLYFWTLGRIATVHHVFDDGSTREKVRNTYNAMAQLESESSWGKLKKSYTYRPDGTLAFATDAGGNATNFSQWQLGVPRRVTYQDGSFELATVNTIGRITSIQDEVGAVTTFTYHPTSGKLASVVPPGGDTVNWNSTTYQLEQVAAPEYGIAQGHWRQTVTTGNARKTMVFDALMRPVVTHELDTTRPSEQSFVARQYDHDGREIFVSRPMSAAFANFSTLTDGTSTGYDALGRVLTTLETSELGTLSTTSEYLTGFRRRTTDPRNYQTTTAFLAFDEPTYDYPTTIELPEGATTTISRDFWGKPLGVRRNGLVNGVDVAVQRRYAYDENMRLCKATDPETGFNTATVIDYDAAGNIAWTALVPSTSWLQCERAAVAAASKAVRTYDTRNRLTNTAYPNGAASVAQSWYADGALQTISSAGATWTYQYNKRRKLELETLAYDGKSLAFDWAYSPQGAVSSLTYPDGLVVDYAPDALGRPTQVGTYASNIQYFANGAPRQFDYGNGVRHTLTQNARQLALRSTDAKNGVPLVDFQYTYDRNANVDGIGDLAQGGLESKVLGYDGLNRLTSASASLLWGTATFQYDPIDNLRRTQVGSRVYAYTYDGFTNRVNQIAPSDSAAFNIGYDARGNVAVKGAQALAFDSASRMLSATATNGSGGGTENYVYDGHGRRVSVQKSGQTARRYMAYGQGGQLLREIDEANLATNYVYLGTSLVARTGETGTVTPVPAVPAPVISSENPSADGTYTISWSTPANTTYYELQESVNGGAVQVYNRTTASWTTPTPRPVGTHAYAARACNTAGCSAWTGTLEVIVQGAPPPLPPNPISASPNPGTSGLFTVTWTASVGATSYRLKETTSGTVQLYSGTGTNWTTPVARPVGTYSFYAEACNAVGCSQSQTLTVVVAVVPILLPPDIVTALPSPSTDGNYTVAWSAAAGATRYEVSEVANGEEQGVIYVTPDATTRQYVVSARASGNYVYRVRTCDATRCSQFSGPATMIVQRPDTPTPPGEILVEGQSQVGCNGQNPRTFGVSWTPVGAQPHHFEIQEDINFSSSNFFDVPGTETFVILTRHRVGSTIDSYYTYRIRACTAAGGDSGCSAWRGSAEICVGRQRRPDEPMAIATTYYHTDALGSPVAETDTSGTVTKRTRYEPYGAPTNANYVNGPGYTGHATDALTKLTYMQQRYYDPLLGRFLSIDPVATELSTGRNFNRYWYANNNPYRFVDPDGREVTMSGAEEDRKRFADVAYKTTGIKTKEVDGKLTQVGARDPKVGSAGAAATFKGALDSKTDITVAAVSDRPDVIVDSFMTNEVDAGDLEAAANQDVNFGGALLTHVLAERMEFAEHGGTFEQAHNKALTVEAGVMGASTRKEGVTGLPGAGGQMTIRYNDAQGKPVQTFSIPIDDKGNWK